MKFKSFQERMGLSDEDFINFEKDMMDILKEEEMFEDDSEQEQYDLEMDDRYSIENSIAFHNDLHVGHYMTDEECPF